MACLNRFLDFDAPMLGISSTAKIGLVQISQIPGNISCGFAGCGILKSEGFGDGCTALGALPSPSCA